MTGREERYHGRPVQADGAADALDAGDLLPTNRGQERFAVDAQSRCRLFDGQELGLKSECVNTFV